MPDSLYFRAANYVLLPMQLQSDIRTDSTRRLHRMAVVLVGLILLLIFFGGQVKSTNSGLSVPDWPNTYGHFMFTFPWDQMVGGIFWEHSHRMIASIVGILTFVLTWWIMRVESRDWLRKLALAASAAVLLQGVLGGLTVLYGLPAWISSSHGTLAQIYLCMAILIAMATSRYWVATSSSVDSGRGGGLRRLTLLTLGAIFVQLILGAVMRHSEAGLAIPDFPLMFGSLIPPLDAASLAEANRMLAVNGILSKMRLVEVTQAQILAHAAHRLWAVVVTVMVFWTGIRIWRRYGHEPLMRRPAIWLMVMVSAQITLGILAIFTEKQPTITTLHVVTGAITLSLAFQLTVRTRRLLRPALAEAPRDVGSFTRPALASSGDSR